MSLTKLKRPALLMLLAFLGCRAAAQTTVGASARAMSGIGSIQPPGYTGIFNSPASARWDSSRTLIADAYRPFGVSTLGQNALGFTGGARNIRIGFLWQRSGSQYFNRQEFRLQFAGRISSLLTMGLGIHYRLTSMFGQYGRKGIPAIQWGMALKAGQKTDVVADWNNVVPFPLSDYVADQGISHLRFGVRHRVSAQAGLLGEVHARYGDFPNQTILRGGIWYQLGKFRLLAGTGTGPEPFSFGAGFQSQKLRLDFAGAYHPSLGFSPQVTFNCIW